MTKNFKHRSHPVVSPVNKAYTAQTWSVLSLYLSNRTVRWNNGIACLPLTRFSSRQEVGSKIWQRRILTGFRKLHFISCQFFIFHCPFFEFYPLVCEVCGCTLCLVLIRSCSVFLWTTGDQLVKDNGLPDNEQIAFSHIWLSLSAVIELVPISVTIHYIISPCCTLK